MGVETAAYAVYALEAIAAVAAINSGMQQADAAEEQATIAANNAAYEKDAAKQRADKIRKLGRLQQGETKAALAASGVKVGEGTALELQKDIGRRVEEDALTAILGGNRAYSSSMAESAAYSKASSNATTNSVLSAGSSIASGWAATSKKTTIAETRAA